MKKSVFLLVLLSACASQQPTEAQLAVWTYFAYQCGYSGSDDVVTAMRADQKLYGCVINKVAQADAAYRSSHSRGTNPIEQTGNALQDSARGQPRTIDCSTRPDYYGGFNTSCR